MAKEKNKADELIETVIKNPDEFFPSFSEEMAEKAREELRKLFNENRKGASEE